MPWQNKESPTGSRFFEILQYMNILRYLKQNKKSVINNKQSNP